MFLQLFLTCLRNLPCQNQQVVKRIMLIQIPIFIRTNQLIFPSQQNKCIKITNNRRNKLPPLFSFLSHYPLLQFFYKYKHIYVLEHPSTFSSTYRTLHQFYTFASLRERDKMSFVESDSQETQIEEVHSLGHQFNMLCNETIVEYLDPEDKDKTVILKKQLKKIEEFDIKKLEFNEIVGYWILSKLYYIEEKVKQNRIGMGKFSKVKNILNEKISKGMRAYDKIADYYALRCTPAEDSEDKEGRQPKTSADDRKSDRKHGQMERSKQSDKY